MWSLIVMDRPLSLSLQLKCRAVNAAMVKAWCFSLSMNVHSRPVRALVCVFVHTCTCVCVLVPTHSDESTTLKGSQYCNLKSPSTVCFLPEYSPWTSFPIFFPLALQTHRKVHKIQCTDRTQCGVPIFVYGDGIPPKQKSSISSYNLSQRQWRPDLK